MSLTPSEQFSELARKSENPIILLPSYPAKDALASAFALATFLTKLGKSVTLAGDDLSLRVGDLPFLALEGTVLDSLSGTHDFVLAFNTKYNKILSIRSAQEGDEFRISLTPEKGSIDPRDFSFIPAQFKYDVAFVVGAPDKESLGKLYEDHPDIFYEIPIVDIDNKPENENFGQLNMVDLTASSVGEILFEAFSAIDPKAIDEKVAEALLAAIIAATDSFQKKNTTPKALQTASKLIELGADREKIVLSLYKTQPLHLLKLWGRLMSNLKWEESLRLAYVSSSIEDFVQSRSDIRDIPAVLDKIRGNLSSGAFYAVLSPETDGTSRAILKSSHNGNAATLASAIDGATIQGDTVSFPIAAPAGEPAERMLIDTIRGTLERK